MELDHQTLVLWGALLIGVMFGVVGQRSGFCLMSGLRGLLVSGDWRKIRAFALAMAVALIGTQLLRGYGLVDLSGSLYWQRSQSWLLLPLGGALFGYGMVLANGCGARALVLLGTGNLRSFVVLVCLGISAFVALTGLLAPWRLQLADWTSLQFASRPPTLDGLLAGWGLSASAQWLATLLMAGPLVWFALSSSTLRRSPADWLGGVLIGSLVPAGWFVTGYLGADDFEPVRLVTLTFVAPIGDSIQYLMLSTGTTLQFGVVVVGSIVLGSAVSALMARQFRWQSFDSPQHMLRAMVGGALMGVGGALALGCSIGQGISGISTLALGSILAAAGIFAGAVAGLRGPLRVARH
jgi:uncharacterized protein